ncbi:uncharacterized protein PRCAT00004090001 [Priceomyces carsonii]|uniref:uncharacterized protein n=1 Tax=Priceomyces carsonii TaxID=28549 RepID=UPI002EDA6025|nr:unnamed protein product [Priceomyces carsonii]
MSSSSIDKPAVSHDLDFDNKEHESIRIDGAGNEFVIIGNKKYYRHELMMAFGGTLNPERYAPYPVHQFGNASAMGLCAFSMTTFVLGLYLAGAMGIAVPNVVVSLTFFYGGVVQMLAGVYEILIGNTFAATAFASYGPFWMSYGAIFVDNFGITAAYEDEPEQLANATGFFLVGWAIFTFLLLLCTLKSTVMFVALFLTLDLAFILLAAANMTGKTLITKAGGVMAVISACCGWYNAFAGVSTKHNSYLRANPVLLPIIGGGNS